MGFLSGKSRQYGGRGTALGQSKGVSKSVRAARARKGHQRRGSHLFVRGKGGRVNYRQGGSHLF